LFAAVLVAVCSGFVPAALAAPPTTTTSVDPAGSVYVEQVPNAANSPGPVGAATRQTSGTGGGLVLFAAALGATVVVAAAVRYRRLRRRTD
jgi:hypothetical protein